VHAAEIRWRDRPRHLKVSATPERRHCRFPVGSDLAARMLALQMRRSPPAEKIFVSAMAKQPDPLPF
jgi:hypothetical protein